MTIDEAIKTLDDYNPEEEQANYHKIWQALQLGIEALKRVKWHKDQHKLGYYELLPGETEE